MRILKKLIYPVTFLAILLAFPLRLRAQRRLLAKHGWAELWLEGEVMELRPLERWAQDILRKVMRRSQGPRVVLSRLRAFVDAFIVDRHAKGVLVRIGGLGGGWASADAIRRQLLRIQQSGREVLVFIDPAAGNREMLVASSATRILMPPSGALAPTGTAAFGLFLKETLDKIGVQIEVAAKGKYKSAPEQFTRTERSDFDRAQTERLVKAVDDALLQGLVEGGRFTEESAQELLTKSPMVGTHALAGGFVQGLTREEDLIEDVQTTAGADKPPKLLGAGTYINAHSLKSPFHRRRKRVGVVEVHGAIVDQGRGMALGGERMAVRKAVVDDLRAALSDKSIGAVVLHVNSRGGSVTASDAIWAAVRRVDKDKPVIACFGDVAASGGYYVACGARNIVASPLTVTGSIGVFAMLPTWPELAKKLAVGHDVISQYRNAALYDPWRGLDEHAKAHASHEVAAMYDSFLELVGEARGLPVEAVHEVAEGRVWVGSDALEQHLVDGLGGIEEAVQRAKDEAGGRFEADPTLIRSFRNQPRPAPFQTEAAATAATIGWPGLDGGPSTPGAPMMQPNLQAIWRLLSEQPGGEILTELAALSLGTRPPLRAVAYLPLSMR